MGHWGEKVGILRKKMMGLLSFKKFPCMRDVVDLFWRNEKLTGIAQSIPKSMKLGMSFSKPPIPHP